MLSVVLTLAIAWALGAQLPVLMSLAPKSATMPIAMLVADAEAAEGARVEVGLRLQPDAGEAEQVAAVRQVKRFESGMVVNPITIAPTATLAEAEAAVDAILADIADRKTKTHA